MPSATIDPAVARFVVEVSRGAASLPDSIAALLIRAVARITQLERAVQQQAVKLAALEKTKPPLVTDAAPPPNGGPVSGPVRKPPGRPPQGTMGRRDAYPHRIGADKFISSCTVDSDFDAP
jgi:hypothetical protein